MIERSSPPWNGPAEKSTEPSSSAGTVAWTGDSQNRSSSVAASPFPPSCDESGEP